jgi:carbohydrate-binding DOMON domain-containing protein
MDMCITPLLPITCSSYSDSFQIAKRFISGGSITKTIQHANTRHIHNTQITQSNTNKTKEGKQFSSQSYTNSEEHITANEYTIQKREDIKLSLM